MSEIQEEIHKGPGQGEKTDPTLAKVDSVEIGKIAAIDDAETRDFYGSSTTDSYRLKSELVSRCLEEVGMGRCASLSRQCPWELSANEALDTNGDSSSSPDSDTSLTTYAETQQDTG